MSYFRDRTSFGMIQTTGQVNFISYFFGPSNGDRCHSVDSGSAIQIGPSMIRMLGLLLNSNQARAVALIAVFGVAPLPALRRPATHWPQLS
ncbi:hypothetical protein AB7M56_006974 [Bradyrhizobium elkanii]|nr:hypothetical protein [Bradyrhizobium elkanii]MCS3520149.1 hypothetical protein [Bradyrhizobium elkanii]MCS4067804.1 hypothetical protein [Bradyrhizobium elkanii]MCS4083340.1 hypothetical protein [Bradyrhizobium elkanii]MCS4105540.1 hypothetical protein [Bradyrhizobium elkanii]